MIGGLPCDPVDCALNQWLEKQDKESVRLEIAESEAREIIEDGIESIAEFLEWSEDDTEAEFLETLLEMGDSRKDAMVSRYENWKALNKLAALMFGQPIVFDENVALKVAGVKNTKEYQDALESRYLNIITQKIYESNNE